MMVLPDGRRTNVRVGGDPGGRPVLFHHGTPSTRLAAGLGIGRFATVGVSGGGPYALATALAAPGRVSGVAMVAGIGPWRLINPVDPDDEERQLLAGADAGDIGAALAGFRRQLAAENGDILAIVDDEARPTAWSRRRTAAGWPAGCPAPR
ncbi:alpha/beta fold hydrolase [Actinoplanes sp. NPDC000266]